MYLENEPTKSFETLTFICKTTKHHIPADDNYVILFYDFVVSDTHTNVSGEHPAFIFKGGVYLPVYTVP